MLDPQHPEIMEEARYWVTISETRIRRDKAKSKLKAKCGVQADPQAALALAAGLGNRPAAPLNAVNIQQMLALQGQTPPCALVSNFEFTQP